MLLYAGALVLAAAVIPFLGEAILFGAAIHALRGPRQAAEALLILAVAIIINKSLVGIDISLLRWVVLAAAAGRAVWDGVINALPAPPAFWLLTVLVSTMVLGAFVVSWLPTVSLFKAISFYLGAGTAMVTLYRTRHLAVYWQSLLLTLAVFMILGSVPLYALPQYGFARNGVGFQGLMTHPQTYGPLGAVLTAYVTSLVLFERQRSWLLVATTAAGWAGVYFSQSRTGMLAVILAGGITVLIGLFKTYTWAPKVRQAFSGPALALGLLGLGAFAVVYGPDLSEGVVEFLLKDEAAEGVTEALEGSRRGLIERSMANYYESPLLGIGLGVPSDLSRARIEYGPMGLPIGATVEKGFTPSAVLEETGVLGAAFLLGVLALLIVPILRKGSIALFWMAGVLILINLGEAVIFAIGGNGLFVWYMWGLAYSVTPAEIG